MRERPVVSIVMAVYQTAKFLPVCLNSIVAQTRREFELICVDDASTDGSADVLRDYAGRDPRFHLIVNPKRIGGGASRNLASRIAAGKYIYFMDPDDALHPRMLECVLYFAERENADVVSFGFCRNAVLSPSEQLSTDLETMPFQLEEKPFFRMGKKGKFRIHYNYWTKIYRRDALDGICFLEGTPGNPHVLSDFHHTALALNRMRRCIMLHEVLYSYTCRSGSETKLPIDERRISNYRLAVIDLADKLDADHHAEIRRHLRDYPISSVVRGQLRRIKKLKSGNPSEAARMQVFFRQELQEIRSRGLLSGPWFQFQNLREWLQIYKMLMP